MKLEHGVFNISELNSYSPDGCTCEVQTNKSGNVHDITVTFNMTNTVTGDAGISISPSFTPTFHWSPHLTPEDGFIAAQHIFRTPALIASGDGRTLIILPHPNSESDIPLYLDMDAVNNRLYVGLSQSLVYGHVLYKKKVTEFAPGKYTIGITVLEYNEELTNPFRPVLEFFWSRYGKADASRLLGHKTDLLPYVKHTYRWAFKSWKDVVWQEFNLNGKRVGAPVFIVTTTQSPGYSGIKRERELRSVWNQAWFCSLRSASGLYRHAKRRGDKELLNYALMTKELALAFEQRDGLFHSVAATEMETLEADGKKYMRSLGWDTLYVGNSDRNPQNLPVKTAPFHLLDMSFTCYYMLMWYDELEKDVRLLDYAIRYADKLVSLQLQSGFFPGFIDNKGLSIGVLDDSPETSLSAAFLIYLYKLTGNDTYREAAKRGIDAVVREIVPTGRWEDFETYWSCSHYWNDRVGQKIERNNMYKQCNFSMYFTALALIDYYDIKKEQKYLAVGQRVLDEMLMTQSSYQPKGISVPVICGFGVLNADAELNDARQSLFSELIMRYGDALSMDEYTKRGLGALRISFSMMYCPENPEAKEQWEQAWPFLSELDYGFNMENYGHNGEVGDGGLGIGEFTIYDWGNGAASEAYERMYAHYEKRLEETIC